MRVMTGLYNELDDARPGPDTREDEIVLQEKVNQLNPRSVL